METLLLKEQTLAPEERKNYLLTAHKHCQRLSTLVEDLFELAKLDASESGPHTEPFSISDLMQDVIQKFQLTAEKKGIRITVDLEDNLPFVNADIGLIERVFENLIENALQHTPEGGTITLGLATDGSDVAIQVRDTGKGISENDLPHIFDRFYQVDKSRRFQAGHSGLGLAITKRILEIHGKDITVKSTEEQGTILTFKLPAVW